MKIISLILIGIFFLSETSFSQNPKELHILIIGAHPDDAEESCGTAALYINAGHKVKLVSVTNGDAGHQTLGGGELMRRRQEEARKSGEILGVEYQLLDNHDGELMPTLENRRMIIRLIREFHADIVITHRLNDYHPDHRNTSQLVLDAAYMVTVPIFVLKRPFLKRTLFSFLLQIIFQNLLYSIRMLLSELIRQLKRKSICTIVTFPRCMSGYPGTMV